MITLVLLVVVVAACGDDDETPPTEVRVITNTPTTQPAGGQPTQGPDVGATLDAITAQQQSLQATIDAQATQLAAVERTEPASTSSEPPTTENTAAPTQAATQPPTQAATTAETDAPSTDVQTRTTPTVTATETDLPSLFPTPRREQVIVVEQVFERGNMFWFRDRRTIWVAVGDEIDPVRGEWLCFNDTFVEGDVESLPEFDPPADATTDSNFPNAELQQPIRGFGKIWRENEDLREQIGYALASEVEHSEPREYIAGGVVDENDNYIPGPGEYRVRSFYKEVFTFLEEELNMSCPSGTWRSRAVSS